MLRSSGAVQLDRRILHPRPVSYGRFMLPSVSPAPKLKVGIGRSEDG